MRKVTAKYLATHLVEPRTHLPLESAGDELISSTGTVPRVNGVPVFSDIEPSKQWRDELRQTADFLTAHVALPNSTAPCAWTIPWLNDTLLNDENRMVCIGGSFSDDIPHITRGHKFNVDLFAHIYAEFASSVMDAQDTTFVSCWAEDLPFATESVDFVYSRNALDHFDNPVKATVEIHRILKPGTTFCLAVYFDSSFVDAHETEIVDLEFLKKVIEPLFETISIRFIDAEPTAAVFRNVTTKFLHLVGRKRSNGRLSISPEAIEQHGRLITCFKKGLYERENHRGEMAMKFYRAVLAECPLLVTDNWRQLHACLDLLAMTNKEALITAGLQMRDAGIASNWAPVADLVFGRYHLSMNGLPEIERVLVECPGYFNNGQWAATLAKCAAIGSL